MANYEKSFQSYMVGFLLSLILTFTAFSLVEKHLFTERYLYIGLTLLAVMQLGVQSICFLRLNSGTEGRWNLFPFLFVLLIIAILVGGTLWIMYNLNYNMVN